MCGETLVEVGPWPRPRVTVLSFPNSGTHVLILAIFFSACVMVRTTCADDAATTGDFFEAKIRPLVMSHCYECHHGAEAESGFRIDSREGLLTGGDRGPAILPGDANASQLIQAVRYSEQEEVQMPPSGKLAEHEISDLVTWVNAGADWPESGGAEDSLAGNFTRHWAFRPLRPQEPPTDGGDWSEHPVDRFIRHKQVESGITPVAHADRRSLLRRVYFDLIGLPPTFEQIEAFCRDSSPDAFTKVVDDLLQSPYYGERWGRHWMDVVRYADTAGDNADYPIPEMYLYRDYIIDSFNADKPFDQFVREQLAGDILAQDDTGQKYAEQVIATGFLALSRRYATQPYGMMHLTIEDAIETTGRAFLGLTLRCARCHDHKFDPVSTNDYYALYGIFASTRFPYTGSEEFESFKRPRMNLVPLKPVDQLPPAVWEHRKKTHELHAQVDRVAVEGPLGEKLAATNKKIDELKSRLQNVPGSAEQPSELNQEISLLVAQRDELTAEVEKVRGELRQKVPRSDLPDDVAAAYAVVEGNPHDEHVQVGGQPQDRGELVRRGLIEFLCKPGQARTIANDRSGRLELANWLTDPNSLAGSLAARVMINRIWQHHFGRGLVDTPSNFGNSGARPSHPELLEYLANYFVEHDWSVKSMHRLILSSRTYQLSGTHQQSNSSIDPANHLYWRFDHRRLDAEAIRDAMMAVSGTLSLARPGRHPFAPIQDWHWTQHNPFQDVFPSVHRSVYLMTQRFQRHPYLGLFDQPDTNNSTGKRTSSTVPLQSLYLMNNPWVTEQANHLAQQIVQSGDNFDTLVSAAFRLTYGRDPDERESALVESYLQKVEQELTVFEPTDHDHKQKAWTGLAKILLTSNEFLYVD